MIFYVGRTHPGGYVLCVFTKYYRNGNRNCVWNMTRLLLLYQLSK